MATSKPTKVDVLRTQSEHDSALSGVVLRTQSEHDSALSGVQIPIATVAPPLAEDVSKDASVTWLGDENDPTTETNEFMGVTFTKGKAVRVKDNPRLVAVAQANRFFKVG